MKYSLISSILSALGIAAFSMPKEGMVPLIIACIAFFVAWFAVSKISAKKRIIVRLAICLLFFATVTSALTPSVSIALVVAIGVMSFNPSLAFIILFLQTSLAATFQALLSNWLYAFGLELSAPSLMACIALLLIGYHHFLKRLIYPLASLLLTYVGIQLLDTPILIMYLASVSSVIFAASLANYSDQNTGSSIKKLFCFLLMSAVFIGWFLYPPEKTKFQYVFMQELVDAPEYQYYKNYSEVLKHIGSSVQFTTDLTLVPDHSLVIVPWLSAISNDKLGTLKKLANSRNWTVMLIGEHTNYGEVANRVNSLVGREALRDDLVTPAKNSDSNGSLRVADFRAWQTDTIFNRGASINISKFFDRPLLEGDGWWAEKNIGEWLWVGDYKWQPGDRTGRMTLAGSFIEQSSRWIVVGDTSPFLNQQLISDPGVLNRFVELTSLWPSMLRDFVLMGIGVLFLIATSFSFIFLLLLAFVFSVYGFKEVLNKPGFQVLSFDERNFNTVLASSPNLLTSGWKITRLGGLISNNITSVKSDTVYFGLVEDTIQFGNVTLNHCRRIGNILTTEGPRLMDSQVCRVNGNAKILIGTADAAAALEIYTEAGRTILILDTSFLGKKAPLDNSLWLTKTIKKPDR
jgi:hypothetical protein